MSVSPFPSPMTTQFNPSAWDFATYFKYLNSIVTFPRAQQATINFQDPVFLTTRTALTQLADTSYATSEIVAWVTANVTPILGSAFTSAVLQYYFGGIRVATINPLTAGATLAIGNGSATNNVSIMSESNTGILTLGSSGSTISLGAPLTPLYDYPVGTATSPNTPSIGTADTIGFIPATTFIRNDLGDGGAGGGLSLRSVSLTAGTWAVYGFIKFANGQTVGAALGIMFSTVINNSTGSFASKGTQRLGNVVSNTCMGINTMGFITLTTTTTIYFNGRAASATANSSFTSIVAVRVA
jgi:hypothetical protein